MPGRLLIILVVALSILVGASLSLTRGRVGAIHVVAALGEAPGIRQGTRVDFRGLDVGTVEDIALKDSMVILELRITRTDIPLRNTDRVTVRTMGLLGDGFIEIISGRATGRPWKAGDTLGWIPRDTATVRRQAEARVLIDAALEKVLRSDSLAPRPP